MELLFSCVITMSQIQNRSNLLRPTYVFDLLLFCIRWGYHVLLAVTMFVAIGRFPLCDPLLKNYLTVYSVLANRWRFLPLFVNRALFSQNKCSLFNYIYIYIYMYVFWGTPFSVHNGICGFNYDIGTKIRFLICTLRNSPLRELFSRRWDVAARAVTRRDSGRHLDVIPAARDVLTLPIVATISLSTRPIPQNKLPSPFAVSLVRSHLPFSARQFLMEVSCKSLANQTFIVRPPRSALPMISRLSGFDVALHVRCDQV